MKVVTETKLDVYEFGRRLLLTNDLDPVYVVLHEAGLSRPVLRRWLLAYWCFYNVGTASWVTYGNVDEYWDRMEAAAGSKEYPRNTERRHFRGKAAAESVHFLKRRGLETLFDWAVPDATWTAKGLTAVIGGWVGFGPWIAFKVADMAERLGLCKVEFDHDTAMYKGSPTEGAELLWETEGKPADARTSFGVTRWAVNRVLSQLGHWAAPPSQNRKIGVQEVETILCKWKSYMGGHYKIGEDVEATRHGLLRFARCPLSQELLRAGKRGGLWR